MSAPFRSFARNAEDVVLMRGLADVRNGIYVDVGAADPETHNVTHAFHLLGWRGINIEPDAEAHAKLVLARPLDNNVCAGAGARRETLTYHHFPGTRRSTFDPSRARALIAEGRAHRADAVPVITLDEAVESEALTEIHFLRIAAEGLERQVLEGIDLQRIRPWIILVEATLPGTSTLVEPAWEALLTGRGYRRCLFDGINVFYCAEEHPEIAERISWPANALDNFVPIEVSRLVLMRRSRDGWMKAFEFSQRMRHVDLSSPERATSARAAKPVPAPLQPDTALFVDVTQLAEITVITGIQRVGLNLVACLKRMESTLGSQLVFFARRQNKVLRQVRVRLVPGAGPDRLTFEVTKTPVEPRAGDQILFHELDYSLVNFAGELQRMRHSGVRLTFWVYDLFPLARPDWSVPLEAVNHGRWWSLVSHMADRIVCDSWKVLVEVREWLALFPPARGAGVAPPQLRWLHLGADGMDNVRPDLPDRQDAPDDPVEVPRPGARTTFLAVASLHPRKAFDLVLDAFDEVWSEGLDVDLLITGVSWHDVSPDSVMQRLREHPRSGTNLHYRGYLPDEAVKRLYQTCDALVYPSHDEGFGLPVVEAACYGMPSVLRDIPVLREVNGRHGFWFADHGNPTLAEAIRRVHALPPRQRRARARPVSGLLSWHQVTCHLLDTMGVARPHRQPSRR